MTPSEFLAARHALGLSQPEMAGALGLSERTIQYYESGGQPVPLVVELAMRYLQEQANAN